MSQSLSRDQLYDVVDELRDEIGDIADERDEWAWAADELAAVLIVYVFASPRKTESIGEFDAWRKAALGADAALARWKALGAEE